MQIDETSLTPIFIQVSQWLKEEILKGNIQEEEQVPSTNQFATIYKINPATARKGFTMLVDEGILYKKRGIGMFVATGAKERLQNEAREQFVNESLQKVLKEGKDLGLTKEEIVQMFVQLEEE